MPRLLLILALALSTTDRFLLAAFLDEAAVGRVQKLVSKSLPLAKDGHMQMIEDATCLVFLETELDHFAATGISGPKDDAKMIDILFKTWRKMSPRGHELASALTLPERERELVARAPAERPKWSAKTTTTST